jgi:hypothetical protein
VYVDVWIDMKKMQLLPTLIPSAGLPSISVIVFGLQILQ